MFCTLVVVRTWEQTCLFWRPADLARLLFRTRVRICVHQLPVLRLVCSDVAFQCAYDFIFGSNSKPYFWVWCNLPSIVFCTLWHFHSTSLNNKSSLLRLTFWAWWSGGKCVRRLVWLRPFPVRHPGADWFLLQTSEAMWLELCWLTLSSCWKLVRHFSRAIWAMILGIACCHAAHDLVCKP